LNTKYTINKRVVRRWTSLEAAFIDWLETWVILVTIYQALPDPVVKLYRERV
jgi:hypothetical protein